MYHGIYFDSFFGTQKNFLRDGTIMMMNSSSLLAVALFIILSSSTSYKLTSAIGLPTQKYGVPTRLGLILHAIVFYILFSVLEPRM